MRVLLRDEVGLGERAARELRRACLRALRKEGARRDAVLSVLLLDEGEMASLNRRFTGGEGATDVLAFPMNELSAEGFLLGDLALCPLYVAAFREDYGVKEGRELEFVAVHGVLHLLGYRDEDEEGAARMDERQRYILRMRGGSGA